MKVDFAKLSTYELILLFVQRRISGFTEDVFGYVDGEEDEDFEGIESELQRRLDLLDKTIGVK